jgi:hypothetical protein
MPIGRERERERESNPEGEEQIGMAQLFALAKQQKEKLEMSTDINHATDRTINNLT